MSSRTSYDNLYAVLGQVIKKATGRDWWRKPGMQVRPTGPYATIYMTEGVGLESPVVENVELEEPGPGEESFQQVPWGTSTIQVVIEFYKSQPNDTALHAATRMKNALRLEERYWDLWLVCGLVGAVRLIDVSAIFRADIEPRTEIRFTLIANIVDPLPVADNIHEISSLEVGVAHIGRDDAETETGIIVTAPITGG